MTGHDVLSIVSAASDSGMDAGDALGLVLAVLFVGWLLSPSKKRTDSKGGPQRRQSGRTRRPVPKRRKVASKNSSKPRKKFGS